MKEGQRLAEGKKNGKKGRLRETGGRGGKWRTVEGKGEKTQGIVVGGDFQGKKS